jgi:hypothetical protein
MSPPCREPAYVVVVMAYDDDRIEVIPGLIAGNNPAVRFV